MRFGSPWSAGWGSPENHFLYTIPDLSGMAVSGNTYLPFRFKLRSGLDNAIVGLYRNAQFVKNVFVPANSEYNAITDVPWGSQSMSVMPLRLGHLGDPSYADEKVVRVYESVENARVTLQFSFVPKIVVPPLSDGGFTSNWNLSGLQQGLNTALVQGHPAWGRLSLNLAVAAGNVTVTLSSSGTPVASGTAAIGGAPFTVTLAAQNNSGISGSVTISNSVSNISNGTLDIRWPSSIQILRDTFDPPTTVRDTNAFNGMSTIRWTESSDLAAGTYYYRTQPISDTGVAGIQSASVPITTIGRPAPPSNLAYASGNAAATVLNFTPSTTSGATYRAYLATAIGGVLNLNDIQATAIANATAITLPPISGYPGTTYVVLRAVLAGIEERNLYMLPLEFNSAGAFVPARPNSPGIQLETISITSGRSIQIKALYNTDHQTAVATSLQLFTRTPGTSYDFTTSAATASLNPGGTPGLQTATFNYTFPADSYYYLTALAVTAAGTQSPSANAQEILIYASTDSLPAPTGLTAQLSRS